MAGDDGEAPIRSRGEPPRYRERVVDTANPIPTRRGSRREDEWGVEAYTPGQPRTNMPADWDDAPLRPRRERGESASGRGRSLDAQRDAGARAGSSETGPRRDAERHDRIAAERESNGRGRSGATGSRGGQRDTAERGAAETHRYGARREGTGRDRSDSPAAQPERSASARRPRREVSEADGIASGTTHHEERAGSADRRSRRDIADRRELASAAADPGRPQGSERRAGDRRTPGSDAPSRGDQGPSEQLALESGSAREQSAESVSTAVVETARPDARRDTQARNGSEPEDSATASGGVPPAGAARGGGRAEASSTGVRGGQERRGRGHEQMRDGQPGQRQRAPRDQADRWAQEPDALSGNGSRRSSRGRGERADAEHLTRNRAPVSERNGRRVTDRDGDRSRTDSRRSGTSGRNGSGAAGRKQGRTGKSAKQRQQGPSLLDDITRARLEATAREGNGLRAAWAAFRIRTDDLRRVNAAARIEAVQEDGFDRTTAQLTDRGYLGAGGGRMNVVGRPVEYRATTAQVAGLWPWSVGAGAPLIGTPLGSHLHTGAPVCFDPMNWFMRGSFITAPSLFVLGLNGFGKSSLVRRIVLGGVAQGITPLILADVKPDYRRLVEMVGGQVIDLGYGHGKLNPLAGGVLGMIVPMLEGMPALQVQVTQELRARQVTLIAGLVELVRGARVRDFEETLISTALSILYRPGSGFAPENPPIMDNLLEVIVEGGDQLMLDAGADTPAEYQESIKGLRRSLRALTQGPFGAVFNGQTTTPIDTTAVAVCIDVSHVPTGDKKLKAAVMLACWADGFASVEAAHVLADADLGAQRYFQVVMDELWQVLGLGDFMVDRVDELTRLQRGLATSLIMISHTIKDLQSLGSEAAIAKALGFLERARAKIFGALPPEEIKRLDSTIPFTAAEEEMVTGWSAPQALTGEALKPGQTRPPAPGTGKFLLKIGEDRRPGIPFHMEFTISEKESGIHETNQRFSEFNESTARRDGDAAGPDDTYSVDSGDDDANGGARGDGRKGGGDDDANGGARGDGRKGGGDDDEGSAA
ncbi:hypothetical protein [Nocardia albiluteola]|uniref:hypothetical protein n=1 Tax=Nocardia albiluteola TaxID=2842303 RepID=UPI001FD91708|nr:hypothetical protein [Nocardia albiluteola]